MSFLNNIADLLPNFEWLDIPTGKHNYTYKAPGSDRESVKGRDIQQSVSFANGAKVSKSYITNAQWDAFENAEDGYRNKRWWEFHPEAMSQRRSITYLPPQQGEDSPRTGITFYDMLAFCYWLSSKTGMSVYLPTMGEYALILKALTEQLVRKNNLYEVTFTQLATGKNEIGNTNYSAVNYYSTTSYHMRSYLAGTYDKDIGFRIIITNERSLKPTSPTDLARSLSRLEDIKTMPHSMLSEANYVALHRNPESVPRLLTLLKSTNKSQRFAAIHALEWMVPDIAVSSDVLIDYMGIETEANGRNKAYQALLGMGASAVPALIKGLKHHVATVRTYAVGGLCRLHTELNVEVEGLQDLLIEMLKDKDETVLLRALEWLRRFPKEKSIMALEAFKNDPRQQVKDTANASLQELEKA